MNSLAIKKNKIFYIVILLIILLPWFNNLFDANLKAAEVSQEDVTFYEINPCEVSLVQFLISNKKSIFQDHYYFRFSNYQSILCFGKVSGVTLLQNGFYISVGTNNFVNLLLQGAMWVFLLSFIKKNKESDLEKSIKDTSFKIKHFSSLILTSYLFTFSIYAERRYYEKNIYYLNFDSFFSYALLFLVIYFLFNNLVRISLNRSSNLIYYLPFLYLIYSVFSGFNFTFFSAIFVYFGIYSIFEKKINWKLNRVLLVFSLWWIANSTNSYYFNPGKLRGFTSTVYEFNATLFWCLYFFLLVNGLWYFVKNNIQNFEFQKLINNFQLVSVALLILGYLGANFPLLNFFNYYFFGQQKFGINIGNPFIFNEWLEKVSWRGFYSSAESIGEFYGLAILLAIYSFCIKRNLNIYEKVGFPFALLGLYFSNNRAVIVLVIVFSAHLLISQSKYKKILLGSIYSLSALFVIYLVGFEKISYSYDFLRSSLYAQAKFYQYDTVVSSFLNWIDKGFQEGGSLSFLFGIFSVMAYFLNRSEIWGIFAARYNPTFSELIMGTGPFNFGQLYGENIVNETRSVLLPHSSFLSFLVFFGFLGILLILILFSFLYFKNRKRINTLGKMIILFIFINLFKNDVLNYFSSFVLYSFFFMAILNFRNEKLFKL